MADERAGENSMRAHFWREGGAPAAPADSEVVLSNLGEPKVIFI